MSELAAAVRAHFQRPIGAGRPATAAGFRHGRAGWLKSGTVIELWLRLEAGGIAEARFEAFGAPEAIACCSWLCECLPGMPVERARELAGLDIARELALPAEKNGVALIAEDALKAALGIS